MNCVWVCASVCVSVCVGVLAELSKPSPKNELRAWFHPLQRWLGSLALGRFSCCSSCLPLPAPLPFACGRTGQPPRHVSSWVACWFRLYQITTIDYACLLSPVDTLPPPPSCINLNLHLHTQSPVAGSVLSCRVVSCPGSLYHCVCTCRVTQRALLGLP